MENDWAVALLGHEDVLDAREPGDRRDDLACALRDGSPSAREKVAVLAPFAVATPKSDTPRGIADV